jgi:hypothetical protein
MASSLNDTSRNLMLDQLGTVAVFASLHTASPGAGGSNEVSGAMHLVLAGTTQRQVAADGLILLDQSAHAEGQRGVSHRAQMRLSLVGSALGSGDHVDEDRQREEDELFLILAA